MNQTGNPTPSGGTGGRSGTGQARPHRGLDAADADEAARTAELSDAAVVTTGASYQSGGTQGDRAQVDEERKQRDGGAGVAANPQGGADPAPGAPAVGPRRE